MKSNSDFSSMGFDNFFPGADSAQMLEAARKLQQTWIDAAAGNSVGGAADAPGGLAELDKKIADLQAVEHWLKMNTTMLQTTIQGLQVQRATLAAIQQMGDTWQNPSPASAEGAGPGNTDNAKSASANPAAAYWNIMQQQFEQIARATMAASAADPATTSNKTPPPHQPGSDEGKSN